LLGLRRSYKESLTFILDQQGKGEFVRTRVFVAARVAGAQPDGAVPPPNVPPGPDVRGMLLNLRAIDPISAVGLPHLP
jgi:hypothetical protein